eukprot:4045391-Pyramimonas_sp.AAC.1
MTGAPMRAMGKRRTAVPDGNSSVPGFAKRAVTVDQPHRSNPHLINTFGKLKCPRPVPPGRGATGGANLTKECP